MAQHLERLFFPFSAVEPVTALALQSDSEGETKAEESAGGRDAFRFDSKTYASHPVSRCQQLVPRPDRCWDTQADKESCVQWL